MHTHRNKAKDKADDKTARKTKKYKDTHEGRDENDGHGQEGHGHGHGALAKQPFLEYDDFAFKLLQDERFGVNVNIGMANNRSWRNDFAEFVRTHRNFAVDVKWKSAQSLGAVTLVVVTAGIKPDADTKTTWTVWIIWCDQPNAAAAAAAAAATAEHEHESGTTTYPHVINELFKDDAKRKYVFDDDDDLGPGAANVVNLRSIITFHYQEQLAKLCASNARRENRPVMLTPSLADALNVATSLVPMARLMLRGAKHKTRFVENVEHTWVPNVGWNTKNFKAKQEATIIAASFLTYLLGTSCAKKQLI